MATASVGTKLLIGANTVAELTSVSGLELKTDTIDVTALDNAGGFRSFIGGFKDGGEVSVSGFFNPNDTNGQYSLYTLFGTSAVTSFSIVFPSTMGAQWNFSGIVTGITTSADLEDTVKFECKIKVSGQPSLGVTASAGLSALSLSGGGTQTPSFGTGVTGYSYTFTTQTSITVTATAASHTIKLYIDGTYSQDLTSGSASSAIAFAAGVSKKLTIVAYESGKTSKIVDVIAVRTA